MQQHIIQQRLPDLANATESSSDGLSRDNSPVDHGGASQQKGKNDKSSGWMPESTLEPFFEVFTVNGSQISKCRYCGKRYPEGESTGNMAKHARNVHSGVYASTNEKVKKARSLDTFSNRRSLRLSQSIKNEYKLNPKMLRTAEIVTEGFLPFSFVQMSSWRRISEEYVSGSFIQSRTTLTKKLNLYASQMDESILLNLRDTHFVNLQLDIWTAPNGEAFLGAVISFAPNFMNATALDLADSSRVLLNDSGKPHNVHILDFISLKRKKHSGEILCDVLVDLMKKFNLMEKVATITMDNATNNGSLHSYLIHNKLNILKPSAHNPFGGTRYIRCASHVLNIQFQKILSQLKLNTVFYGAYGKILKLAKIMRFSTRINSTLKETGIPFIPLESPTRWMLSWRQIDVFIENFSAYGSWFAKLAESEKDIITSQLRDAFAFDRRDIDFLKYFIEVTRPLMEFTLALQDEDYSNLPNGLKFYYTLKHYYQKCTEALEGRNMKAKQTGIDFSFLNGQSTLQEADKSCILEAMSIAQNSFLGYLVLFERNPLYYLAVVLDPTAKVEGLHEVMHHEEAQRRYLQSENFIKTYFKQHDLEHQSRDTGNQTISEPTIRRKEKSFIDAHLSDFMDTDENCKGLDALPVAMEEWHQYVNEPRLVGGSRSAAIDWWFVRRAAYPRLFKLAMSLFYTKITTCDVERAFSLAGRVMRKDRTRLNSTNMRTLMVLRDRFTQFGFYKSAPMMPGQSEIDFEEDLEYLSASEFDIEDDLNRLLHDPQEESMIVESNVDGKFQLSDKTNSQDYMKAQENSSEDEETCVEKDLDGESSIADARISG
ncbi:putative transposase of the Rover4 hAT-like family [Lachancea mirantina]|uniref:Putative transposase of the Rover4 hAT-like family n=1 Tax=Lachancea mirantina TaxID=1230905 RepID=A0A1G4J078_9SACH|nr:putative transposase of the Rover4 hAT-like family [Lachancea mirantina]